MPKWRCVVNEIPPPCESVLVVWLWGAGDGGSKSHQVLWHDCGVWFDVYGEPQTPPTHWLPLPSPPE